MITERFRDNLRRVGASPPRVVCANAVRHTPEPHYLDRHHIIPESWGGPTAEANLIGLCQNCHHSTHYLIDRYVSLGVAPAWSELRTYSKLVRQLAETAWAHRPDPPTRTLSHHWS